MNMKHHPGIAPTVLHLYPDLDLQQREFIAHRDGPLLAVAGPGAGKTRCIELRAVNLLLMGAARPADLLLTTFSKPAALELRDRFRASAHAAGYSGDISAARISTIHGLCHRIIRCHAGDLGLKPGYRILDSDNQASLSRQEFDSIFGPDLDILTQRGWVEDHDIIGQSVAHFNRIGEEGIEIEEMADSPSSFDAALARCCRRYRRILRERNCLDFSQLLILAEAILDDNRIARELGGRIGYLMVDEAQDTSHIQDRILRRLAEVNRNIVLVGDDDQAIYGFRGARVENMLAFPVRYPDATVLELTTNYRSSRAIVEAYDRWMRSVDWTDPKGTTQYRYNKEIVAYDSVAPPEYPAVIAVRGSSPYDEGRRLGDLARFLRTRGVISRYGQCVLLLHSVRHTVSDPYIDGLEDAGVPIRCVPAGGGNNPKESRLSDELTVTTIHQSKGLEWDVVAVGSLSFHAGDPDPVGRRLVRYFPPGNPRPNALVAEHARMRQHYVAFSRTRRMLILTASEEPHPRFDAIWRDAPRWPDVDLRALSSQRFSDGSTHAPELVVNLGRMKRLTIRMGAPARMEKR